MDIASVRNPARTSIYTFVLPKLAPPRPQPPLHDTRPVLDSCITGVHSCHRRRVIFRRAAPR